MFVLSAFTIVYCKEDWLTCWDHILSNHPSFFLSFVVAFYVIRKAVVMRCSGLNDMKVMHMMTLFFQDANQSGFLIFMLPLCICPTISMQELLSTSDRTDLKSVINEAYRIQEITPDAVHPCNHYPCFKVLPRCYSHDKILIPSQAFHRLVRITLIILYSIVDCSNSLSLFLDGCHGSEQHVTCARQQNNSLDKSKILRFWCSKILRLITFMMMYLQAVA